MKFEVKANGKYYLHMEVADETGIEDIERQAEEALLALDPPPIERRKIQTISVDLVEHVVEVFA